MQEFEEEICISVIQERRYNSDSRGLQKNPTEGMGFQQNPKTSQVPHTGNNRYNRNEQFNNNNNWKLQPQTWCFGCGVWGHKRMACPQRQESTFLKAGRRLMVDSQAGSKSQVSKPVVDSQAGSKSQVSKTTEAEADESRENQVSKPAETEAGEPREKSGLASRQGDYAIAEDILDRAVRRLITMEGLTPVVAVEPVVTSRAVGTPVRDEPISLVSRIQIPAPAQTAVRKEIGTLFGKTRISTPAQNPEKVAAPGIPPQPASQPVFQPWENSFWKPEPVQQKLPSTKSTRNEVSSKLRQGGAIDEIFSILSPWHYAISGMQGGSQAVHSMIEW